jgi:hypothetical protein
MLLPATMGSENERVVMVRISTIEVMLAGFHAPSFCNGIVVISGQFPVAAGKTKIPITGRDL